MSERLLMANVAPDAAHPAESEPVLVVTDDPRVIVLVLDDGHLVELDRTELQAALAA